MVEPTQKYHAAQHAVRLVFEGLNTLAIIHLEYLRRLQTRRKISVNIQAKLKELQLMAQDAAQLLSPGVRSITDTFVYSRYNSNKS